MKKQTIFTISLAVVFMAALYFLFLKDAIAKIRGKKNDETEKELGVFPLQLGSEGREVEQLQRFLTKRYGAKLPRFGFDGKFGKYETLPAVKKFLEVEEVTEDMFKENNIASFKALKY